MDGEYMIHKRRNLSLICCHRADRIDQEHDTFQITLACERLLSLSMNVPFCAPDFLTEIQCYIILAIAPWENYY